MATRDVHVACEQIARRRLEECRRKHEPAYISWDNSACAAITTGTYTRKAEYADHEDFNIISLPIPSGVTWSAETCQHPYNNACLRPSSWPYYWAEEEVSAWEDPSSAQAAWDWRTGKISRAVTHEPVTSASNVGDIPKTRRRTRRRHSQWASQLILATSLRSLASKDLECVIYCRRVQKLGLDSEEILRRHYEKYGPVEDVLMSNGHTKPTDTPVPVRVRASGIALIVMRNKADAAAILADGDTQVVNGVPICVRSFEDRSEEQELTLPQDMASSDAASTAIPGSESAAECERNGDSES